MVGYFYDFALGRMYKNRQAKLVQLRTDLFTGIEGYLFYYTSALGNDKDILGFNYKLIIISDGFCKNH